LQAGQGQPINNLFNFEDGNITIPAPNTWVSVASPDYLAFNPDLLWIQNRNPLLLVTLTTNSINSTLHDPGIEVNLKLDWDPPLARGSRLEVQLYLLRTLAF
jgi:hypothetical protein